MATNTYVALDKQTLGSNAASITFNSIPSGYTDLEIVVNGYMATGSGAFLALRFNGDTGSNYSATYLWGNGSSATSSRFSSQTSGAIGAMYSDMAVMKLSVQNYSNATTYKTTVSRSNSSANNTGAFVSLWRSTAAVTSITVLAQSDLIASGSTFTLYGIKSEAAVAKATGGIITSDATYTYHTFFSTGTFTPLQSLSADILVVAGGGGGGTGNVGGGGGAGGLLLFASQSLSATGYTCTVGAGGTAGYAGGGSDANGGIGNDSRFGALTLVKGGGGGASGAGAASNGGSGGGGWAFNTYGTGTAGQGNNGGAPNSSSPYGSGGGGGAGAVGGSANSTNSGVGGVGYYSTTTDAMGAATGSGVLSSTHYYYAGGGGGGGSAQGSIYGAGGIGGGGAGGASGAGISGTANTGGGGGGGNQPNYVTGGAGGSGLVIVRYAK